MRTRTKNKKQIEKIEIHFCTECGEQLDDFAFEDRAANIQSVLTTHNLCKKTGKFKGECCSKVFIASENLDFFENPKD